MFQEKTIHYASHGQKLTVNLMHLYCELFAFFLKCLIYSKILREVLLYI